MQSPLCRLLCADGADASVCLSVCPRPQVPVQPVSAAGPEHSKPLEKPENLFNQERDPAFSEIYSSIGTGGERGAAAAAPSPAFRCGPSALCPSPRRPARFWAQRGCCLNAGVANGTDS